MPLLKKNTVVNIWHEHIPLHSLHTRTRHSLCPWPRNVASASGEHLFASPERVEGSARPNLHPLHKSTSSTRLGVAKCRISFHSRSRWSVSASTTSSSQPPVFEQWRSRNGACDAGQCCLAETMAGHEILEQWTGNWEDADGIKANATNMDGYGGAVDTGSWEAEWVREGVEATWRMLVCHYWQGCFGGQRLCGKEDWRHAALPNLLICHLPWVFLALLGV